jgi:hypothetical protein
MSDFFIHTHYPSINEKAIPRNVEIKIYLSKEINTQSIDYRTISVHDSLYATVPGTVAWDYSDAGSPSGQSDILTFAPTILLDSYKRYSVYVHKSPNSVVSTDGDELNDTFKFYFTTGSGTIDNLEPTTLEQLEIDLQHALDIEDYALAESIQSLIDTYVSGVIPSGEVTAPSVYTYLDVDSTYPANEQANATLSELRFIQINFNDVPNVSGVAVGDYIDLTCKDVLE